MVIFKENLTKYFIGVVSMGFFGWLGGLLGKHGIIGALGVLAVIAGIIPTAVGEGGVGLPILIGGVAVFVLSKIFDLP